MNTVSPPFDPTPPHPLRYIGPQSFDSVRAIAEKAAAPEGPEKMTLGEFCRRNRIKIKPRNLKGVAYHLIGMTERAGLAIDRVPDPRFGKLNCYPVEILRRYFEGRR